MITREYPAAWEKGAQPYYPMNDEKNNALYERYRELAEKACQALREADGGRLARQVYLTEFYNRKKAR